MNPRSEPSRNEEFVAIFGPSARTTAAAERGILSVLGIDATAESILRHLLRVNAATDAEVALSLDLSDDAVRRGVAVLSERARLCCAVSDAPRRGDLR